MSADLLRRASAQMRRDADRATCGVWKTWGMDVLASTDGVSDVDHAVHIATTTAADTSGRPRTFDADHIIGWHPPVVIALADAIDRFLGVHWSMTSTAWTQAHRTATHWEPEDHSCNEGCHQELVFCNGCGTAECREIEPWIPFALAYLREDG